MMKPGDVVQYLHHTGVLVDAVVREVVEDDPSSLLLDVHEPEQHGETPRTFASIAKAGATACTWRPKSATSDAAA